MIFRHFSRAIALALTTLPLPASAQITGTFVPAQDGVNSFQSVDGTYQGQDKSGASTHNEVVTTITGLTAGQSYDIRMIMGINTAGSSGDQHIDAGFSPAGLTTLMESSGVSTGLALAAGGTWVAAEQLIGTATADPAGELKVYVDATHNAERSVYNGLSYIETTPGGSGNYVIERTLASPDGSLVFTLERDDVSNELAWSVTHDGRSVVTRGVLGVGLSGVGVVGDEGTISQADSRSVDTTWTPPYGERAVIPDVFNEETLTLADAGHGTLTVRLQIRSYDEGVALRYLVDGGTSR